MKVHSGGTVGGERPWAKRVAVYDRADYGGSEIHGGLRTVSNVEVLIERENSLRTTVDRSCAPAV
jgi:hypothetical protein